MLLLITCCILWLSFALNGATVEKLCTGTRKYINCGTKNVILIKEVYRVTVPLSAGDHCGYEVGDYKDHVADITKTVWDYCNLRAKCDVRYREATGRLFVEIRYECLPKTAIKTLSICGAGRLDGNQGYIHSPRYPIRMCWDQVPEKGCKCSATLTNRITIEVKVFTDYFFDSDFFQTLEIHWDSQRETPKKVPHYKEYTHNASTTFSVFFLSRSSSAEFWLEYRGNLPLTITCSGTTTTPAETTTTSVATTTTPATSTTRTTTTKAPVTSQPPVQTNPSTKSKDASPNSAVQGLTAAAVLGPMIVLLIVIAVAIILWRLGLVRFAKRKRPDETDGTGDGQHQILNGRPAGFSDIGQQYINVAFEDEANNTNDSGHDEVQVYENIELSVQRVPTQDVRSGDESRGVPEYEEVKIIHPTQTLHAVHETPRQRPPDDGENTLSTDRDHGSDWPRDDAGSASRDATAQPIGGSVGSDGVQNDSSFDDVRHGTNGGQESPYAALEPVIPSEYCDFRPLGANP